MAGTLEQIVIDGLDVNDYVTRYIADDPPFQFTPAKKKLNWASSALADGAVLVGDEDHYDNAEMVFTVGTFPSADKDTALGVLDELTQKLQEARRNPGGIQLSWTPADSSQTLTFYILDAEYDDLLASRERGWFDNAFTGVVHLYLRPFGYGQERQTPLGYTDPFSRDTWTGGPWRFDAPTPGAGLAFLLALVTSATGNKRIYLPFTTVNSTTLMRFRTSKVSLTSMDVGPIFKRLSTGNYLRAALTSSTFKIATAAGNLASTNFTPTINTFYWIQVSVSGDDIRADLYADADNPLTMPGAVPLATVTYSLTGGETGGPYGATIRGNPGIYLTPNAATLGDVAVTQFTLRGMDDILTTDPLQAFEVPDVEGHVPAEARQVVIEGSGQTRAFYEWGLECRDYDPDSAPALIVDSDSLVTAGFSGVQGTVAGAYDPNATGTNCITATNLSSTNALAIFSTPTSSTAVLEHVGTYKVRARVAGSPGVKCRWAWQIGEGPLRRNNYATLPSTASTTTWYELDLGIITIPRALVGPQAWIGRFEAYSPDTSAGTVSVDYIELIPMERYGILRAPLQPVVPTTFTALDEFNQTGTPPVPLTGKAAAVGGTWTAVAGADARDFNIQQTTSGNSPAATAIRAVYADANLNTGRYVSVGTTPYTAIQVQADIVTGAEFWVDTPFGAVGDNIRIGVFARLTDINNWVALILRQGVNKDGTRPGNLVQLALLKRKSGAVTDLGHKDLGTRGWNRKRTLQLVIDAQGTWAAYSWPKGTRQPGSPIISGVDSDLATGSVPLQSGMVGLFDATTVSTIYTSGVRVYDNFNAFIAPQDAVLYANRHLEIRSGLTKREALGGTRYGNVPQPRGQNFFLPARGANGHVNRMAVKARRTDVDGGTPDSAISDAMTIAVFSTPRYLTPAAP